VIITTPSTRLSRGARVPDGDGQWLQRLRARGRGENWGRNCIGGASTSGQMKAQFGLPALPILAALPSNLPLPVQRAPRRTGGGLWEDEFTRRKRKMREVREGMRLMRDPGGLFINSTSPGGPPGHLDHIPSSLFSSLPPFVLLLLSSLQNVVFRFYILPAACLASPFIHESRVQSALQLALPRR